VPARLGKDKDSLMNPWFRMASHAAFLMWDAQQVMALRMMRIASGGGRATREANTMIAEKAIAALEAQSAAVTGILAGKSPPAVGEGMLRVYKKRVKANRRRLRKS